jgi:FixJ family two-component response regulator
MNLDHMIYIVDDDLSMREAVQDLLASAGFACTTFGSAAEYLASHKPEAPSCIVLDVSLPDINGLDLQRQLADSQHPPIVFITGYGDVPSSVQAMKAGAVDFLSKPFKEAELLAAVNSALARDREARLASAEYKELRERYDSLTRREREVMTLVISGLLNKQAAARLGISEVTLQIHRGQVMRKMMARSLSELVRMSTTLGIQIDASLDRAKGARRELNEDTPTGVRQLNE